MRTISPRIEAAVRGALPRSGQAPAPLREAMRYALFPGGKRLRPALVLLGHRACGGRHPEIARLAASVEFVHTFTLIHDDLPCMDDDDLRRGRPTCHRAYGEALAVLAGDALLNLAYEILSGLRCSPARKAAVIATLSRAVGTRGVLGGQADDVAAEGKMIRPAALRAIHLRKTASLFSASLRMGGELAGGSARELKRLEDFGRDLGLLFQIVDDLLNVEGTRKQLGRPRGGDERRGKATYPRIVGRARSRVHLRGHVASGLRRARGFGPQKTLFEDLVRVVASRVRDGWP